MRVLVVDGANVVGSRPDGWWRDRPGAASRLHERLSTSVLPYDEVVLVLEGQARAGASEGKSGTVRTVHASGSGDETILDLVRGQLALRNRRQVDVVTADRELRTRVERVGGGCLGPSWLLERL